MSIELEERVVTAIVNKSKEVSIKSVQPDPVEHKPNQSILPDPDESVFKALGGSRLVATPSWFNLEDYPQFKQYIDLKSNGTVFLRFTNVPAFKEYIACKDRIVPGKNPVLEEILSEKGS